MARDVLLGASLMLSTGQYYSARASGQREMSHPVTPPRGVVDGPSTTIRAGTNTVRFATPRGPGRAPMVGQVPGRRGTTNSETSDSWIVFES